MKNNQQPFFTNHIVDDTNVQEVINQVLGLAPVDPFFEVNPVKVVHPEEEVCYDTL